MERGRSDSEHGQGFFEPMLDDEDLAFGHPTEPWRD